MKDHKKGKEIFETTYWRVFLMPNQAHLGYCSVSLKRRDCGDLVNITTEEILDFFQLAKKLENALRKAFNATMFNWSCLMNLAYQNSPPTPHVHWHFRPRYNHGVTFAGLEFLDPSFGQHYDWPPIERDVDDRVRKEIIDEIKKSMD